MNPRDLAEARYDAMPPEVAERTYGDPLRQRLAEAEGGVQMMTRFIREDVDAIRKGCPTAESRRSDIASYWRTRRQHQRRASDLRLALAEREVAGGLLKAIGGMA